MYLKTDKIVATLGNVVMRSYQTGAPQYVLDPTAVVGWSDGVDIRRNFTPRMIRSGDFLEAGRHAARYITFSGTAVARSAGELHLMRDDFTGMVLPKTFSTLSVEDISGIRYATVSIGGKTSWIQLSDTSAAFKIDLYAPDPNIYGVQKNAQIPGVYMSGGIGYPMAYPLSYSAPPLAQVAFISNQGNTDAWATFTATGDYPSGFIINDGRGSAIQYNGPVGMSAPVTLDTQKGTATQNGVDKSFYLSQRNWFAIPPKVSIQPGFVPLQQSNGWCDIIYRDTWI